MKVRVIGTREAGEWNEALHRLPEADVYHLPEYHHAYELNGDGDARLFIAESDRDILVHPFLLRPIDRVGRTPVPGGWWDIETVYGYSGPLSSGSDPSFLEGAWEAFGLWCRQNRVVAEFIRFNPLLENHAIAGQGCTVTSERPTVVLNLEGSEEDLWKRYPKVQRNMVRKAESKELAARAESDPSRWAAFRHLYEDTMRRVQSDPYYLFSPAYHDHLQSAAGSWVRLFTVNHGDRVAAAAIFLFHGDRAHYHLAGSDPVYRGYAANNLLLHEVARWGQKHGCRRMHLGGGLTSDENDSLFSFKAGLSNDRLEFRVGRRIHDREAYDSLCSQWMREQGLAERPRYFLLYRLKEAP